jgi:hypothetical protein
MVKITMKSMTVVRDSCVQYVHSVLMQEVVVAGVTFAASPRRAAATLFPLAGYTAPVAIFGKVSGLLRM